MGYQAKKVLKNRTSQAVAASQTNQVVSDVFALTAEGATRGLRIDIHVSAITVAAAITAQLQHAVDADSDFAAPDNSVSKVSLTGATAAWFSIPLSATDADDDALFPLRPIARIVVTTGAGDSVTIDDIRVSQPD
jgi:peptidoglycan hydrolase-like protein with peptidoglycan-binding domain